MKEITSYEARFYSSAVFEGDENYYEDFHYSKSYEMEIGSSIELNGWKPASPTACEQSPKRCLWQRSKNRSCYNEYRKNEGSQTKRSRRK